MKTIQTLEPGGPVEMAPLIVGGARLGKSLVVMKVSRRWCHCIVWASGRIAKEGFWVDFAVFGTRVLREVQSWLMKSFNSADVRVLAVSFAVPFVVTFPFVLFGRDGRDMWELANTFHPKPA